MINPVRSSSSIFFRAVNSLKRSNGTTYTDLATMLAEVSPFFDEALGAGAILYGVERLRNSADPQFVAIGDVSFHVSMPIHSLRKIVKVNAAREIVGTLKQTDINFNEDGTASVLDGSDGECIYLYLQIELNGQKRVLWGNYKFLIEQLKQVPAEALPFKATIVNEHGYMFR